MLTPVRVLGSCCGDGREENCGWSDIRGRPAASISASGQGLDLGAQGAGHLQGFQETDDSCAIRARQGAEGFLGSGRLAVVPEGGLFQAPISPLKFTNPEPPTTPFDELGHCT